VAFVEIVDVGVAQTASEFSEGVFVLLLDEEVKMVGHEAVGDKLDFLIQVGPADRSDLVGAGERVGGLGEEGF